MLDSVADGHYMEKMGATLLSGAMAGCVALIGIWFGDRFARDADRTSALRSARISALSELVGHISDENELLWATSATTSGATTVKEVQASPATTVFWQKAGAIEGKINSSFSACRLLFGASDVAGSVKAKLGEYEKRHGTRYLNFKKATSLDGEGAPLSLKEVRGRLDQDTNSLNAAEQVLLDAVATEQLS